MDVGTLLAPALDAVQAGLVAIAPTALGVGAIMFAVTQGWRLMRRLVGGDDFDDDWNRQ